MLFRGEDRMGIGCDVRWMLISVQLEQSSRGSEHASVALPTVHAEVRRCRLTTNFSLDLTQHIRCAYIRYTFFYTLLTKMTACSCTKALHADLHDGKGQQVRGRLCKKGKRGEVGEAARGGCLARWATLHTHRCTLYYLSGCKRGRKM